MNLKNFFKTENIAMISTGSKTKPDQWGETKKKLYKQGLYANKITNTCLKKALDQSSLSRYQYLSAGSVLITRMSKKFNKLNLKNLSGNTNMIKTVVPLSLKLHNKLYPISWLTKGRCIVYEKVCITTLDRQKKSIKKMAKLSYAISKLTSKQRDSNT